MQKVPVMYYDKSSKGTESYTLLGLELLGEPLELPQKNRLDVLKLELLRSIDGNIENKSSRSGGFTILAFHSTTEAFPKNRVCRYDDSHGIKKAKKFIDELRPAGGTMMAAAWKLALKLCKKQGIDTVYFMTDGFPGDNFNEKWLAKELKHHRLTELKINCVAVGSDHQFMKNIAQSNHGKYVFIP